MLSDFFKINLIHSRRFHVIDVPERSKLPDMNLVFLGVVTKRPDQYVINIDLIDRKTAIIQKSLRAKVKRFDPRNVEITKNREKRKRYSSGLRKRKLISLGIGNEERAITLNQMIHDLKMGYVTDRNTLLSVLNEMADIFAGVTPHSSEMVYVSKDY